MLYKQDKLSWLGKYRQTVIFFLLSWSLHNASL